MTEFERMWPEILAAVKDLGERSWKDFREAAIKAEIEFAEKTKADLSRWAALLAEGKITQEEFAFLVGSRKDLAEVEGLKEAGLAAARVERFKAALVEAVVGAVVKVVL